MTRSKPEQVCECSIDDLTRAWEDQLSLCDALEVLADELPVVSDRSRCLVVARAIPLLLERAHRLEEKILFPVLHRKAERLPDMTRTINRLRYEHIEDECYAEELHEALAAHGRGHAKPSSETLGYMMRAYFSASRRHIRFDNEILLPMLTGAT